MKLPIHICHRVRAKYRIHQAARRPTLCEARWYESGKKHSLVADARITWHYRNPWRWPWTDILIYSDRYGHPSLIWEEELFTHKHSWTVWLRLENWVRIQVKGVIPRWAKYASPWFVARYPPLIFFPPPGELYGVSVDSYPYRLGGTDAVGVREFPRPGE